MPRSESPCAVGCATTLEVRRKRLKPGTWRSKSSTVCAADWRTSSRVSTVTLAGASPEACSRRVGVTTMGSSRVGAAGSCAAARDARPTTASTNARVRLLNAGSARTSRGPPPRSPPRASPGGRGRRSTSSRRRQPSSGPAARSQAAPHLARQLDAERELRPLVPDRHVVALDGRGEAALGADAELVERDVLGRLVEAPLEVVLLL